MERERLLSRSQNEAAERLRGLTAKEQAAEQVRQQYEAALPQLYQNLAQQGGEFADVKTWADVERIQAEDPFGKYQRWQLHNQKMEIVQRQVQEAQQRQQQEQAQRFAEYASQQDSLFREKAPDLADPVKAEKMQKAAANMLRDLGLSDAELGQAWNGGFLRDHRVQLLIRDATELRQVKSQGQGYCRQTSSASAAARCRYSARRCAGRRAEKPGRSAQ